MKLGECVNQFYSSNFGVLEILLQLKGLILLQNLM